MRMLREDCDAMALVRKREIAYILAGTGGEALIFDPADGLSDSELRHGDRPIDVVAVV